LRFTLTLLLSLLVSVCMMAQAPVANFSASVTSGCSPVSVAFTDLSTGAPKFWNWDFGNGQLSSSQNPSVSFAPGTYSITLVVRNNDGVNSITKTNLIVSNPSPNAGFTSDKQISCAPTVVHFTDMSNANAGTLNEWTWDFGDGSPVVTQQNPTHTYTSTGYFGVYLRVKSTTGCQSEAFYGRYMRIVTGVKANFDPAGPTTCQSPFIVTYKNLTSGPGNLTYAWDLGNSTTSSSVSPQGTYATGGSYTIKLKAQSDFGCSDSIQKSVPINGIATTFTAPANVCLGSAAAFQSTSSPSPVKVAWFFGDGTTSTLLNPSKTYTVPGAYTVKMVGTFAGCTDSVSKTVNVYDKPVASFSSSKNGSCKAPLPVTFTNTSPDAVSSAWTFGDGGTGASHPVATHTYNTTGSNDVTLAITDSKGCKNTVTIPSLVNIFAPNVQMGSVPPGLCVGQSFTPSPIVGTVDGVATYSWDFGDGTPADPATYPTHSYSTTGIKTIKLTIVTTDGCTGSATRTVQVGDKPIVDFTADKTSACRNDLITFTNTSTPVAGSTAYWYFYDGDTSSLFNPPPHRFNDTGYQQIKLVVTSNGCADSTYKNTLVYVKPPIANFKYKITDCLNKNFVTFIDTSLTNSSYGPIAYEWKFGDAANTTTTTVGNTSFTYPGPPSTSVYNVTLTVTNGACQDVITKPVQLINDPANIITARTTYCRNEPVRFQSTNNTAFIKEYRWQIDGQPYYSGNVFEDIPFSTAGVHTARFMKIDLNDCVDISPLIQVTVTGPTARFTVTNKGGCVNGNVSFTDASAPAPGGSITKWVFDFGDGTPVQTFTAPPFTHTYANTGKYDVKLTVFDNTSSNCSDTFTLKGDFGAIITKPLLSFGAQQTIFCPNVPLQFTDSSVAGALTYVWDFGDGTTDNVQNPLHSYAGKDSVYTVKLIATDSVGCVDSIVRNNYIKVRLPKPLYNVKDTVTLCPPLETQFFSKSKDIESVLWDFGDGTPTSNADTTNHFYNNYGNFTAKLYAVGFGGCVDSTNISIRVTNPYANTTVLFDPKTNCNDLTVNFNVTTPFGTAYQFYFGDGYIDTTQATSFSHFYNLPNQYAPAILLYDSTGCQAYFGGFGNVDVRGAVPIFGMDKKKFCDTGTIYFTDYSQEARDPIVTRTWDFGDGTSGVFTGNQVHRYQQPGLYIPTLTVNAGGCDKAFTDTVRVLATPTPIITSADGICNDLIIDFSGSLLVPPDTAITWKWDFGKGRTSGQQNVSINFPDTGLHKITLEASNSLGCKGDTTKDITVFPLPSITLTGDTTVIAGAGGLTIPLTYSANANIFSWTPEDFLSCTNCATPLANPKFTTKYHVKVTDLNGCVSNRDLTVVVLCNNKNFFIPNTFSPNGDGSNDRFYPRGTGLDRIQALRIFNRWGEMVFEKRNFPANDAASGWDGTYKGKTASSDTYIFMIDIICENATIITYKGNITLIR